MTERIQYVRGVILNADESSKDSRLSQVEVHLGRWMDRKYHVVDQARTDTKGHFSF